MKPMSVARRPRATAAHCEAVNRAAHDAVMRVSHVDLNDAHGLMVDRGVVATTDHPDIVRTFARGGRLIALRATHGWVCPRFQIDHFDPNEAHNIIADINQQLDAGRFPESATSWWTVPSGSLPGHPAPADLPGSDHDALRQLATAYAAGPNL